MLIVLGFEGASYPQVRSEARQTWETMVVRIRCAYGLQLSPYASVPSDLQPSAPLLSRTTRGRGFGLLILPSSGRGLPASSEPLKFGLS